MDKNYKNEIIKIIEGIDNQDFLVFLFKLINSLKRKWGV